MSFIFSLTSIFTFVFSHRKHNILISDTLFSHSSCRASLPTYTFTMSVTTTEGDSKRKTISPYNLTSGDNPGEIISQPLLNGLNYDEWAINFRMALSSPKKFGFIDGTILNLRLDLLILNTGPPTTICWLDGSNLPLNLRSVQRYLTVRSRKTCETSFRNVSRSKVELDCNNFEISWLLASNKELA